MDPITHTIVSVALIFLSYKVGYLIASVRQRDIAFYNMMQALLNLGIIIDENKDKIEKDLE